MLDIKWIRENPVAFDAAMARRGRGAESPKLLALDEARRKALTSLQECQERRNVASKEIGKAMGAKDMALADSLKAEVSALKDKMSAIEAEERTAAKELDDLLASLPNIPHTDVPDGKDEHDNIEIRSVGDKPRMNFKPREHFEIGEALGMMDFNKAAQISGSRFTILKGQLARLERAIGQFFLDVHTGEHGYEEVVPPLLVREEAFYGTGQLPKFEEDLFFTDPRPANWVDDFVYAMPELVAMWRRSNPLHTAEELKGFMSEFMRDAALGATIDGDKESLELKPLGMKKRLGLIPTSEVPLTNMVREEILDHAKLPIRYTALTPCFRSEAGSAGRDTRGMLRQHQFYKVEMVSITDADSSLAEHDRMTACAEEVLKRLGLHFRTVVLCTGDMGFGAQKTHDIEVWLPGQNAYREISSCSTCGDFQARRMNARYRPEGEKATRFVHTLNGSGVAVGRALIAVIENYQNDDGSITIPQELLPYMGGLTKIERK
jgi:seryl-tRNA synthetase